MYNVHVYRESCQLASVCLYSLSAKGKFRQLEQMSVRTFIKKKKIVANQQLNKLETKHQLKTLLSPCLFRGATIWGGDLIAGPCLLRGAKIGTEWGGESNSPCF